MNENPTPVRRVCIVGISGKLGQYMTEHALARGYEVHGVCRPESVQKLARFGERIRVFPGRTDDRAVLARALAGCQGVLTVLAPWGMQQYASGTAQGVLDLADPGARLAFSCGWHITRDGRDRYGWAFLAMVAVFRWVGLVTRFAELDDQVEACRRIFESDRAWTVVRGSDLEEGPSEGLPVWSAHVGDPVLKSNRTRRVDFARFMVESLTDPTLVREAPAIVSCQSRSARTHARPRLASPAAASAPITAS